MEQPVTSGSPEEKNQYSFWERIKIKWDLFIDGLLTVISIWGTLAILAYFHPRIDDITHHIWWLELIFIVIIFFICLITTDLLKPIILLAGAIGCIYILVSVFAGDTNNRIIHNHINYTITNYLDQQLTYTDINVHDNDSLYKVILSLKAENDSLKNLQLPNFTDTIKSNPDNYEHRTK